MQCKVCQKGEIKNYADGTCHCNNQKCLMTYTPAVYGRGSLNKREPLTGYEKLINTLKLVWEVKPELIGVAGVIMIFLTAIVWVWMATRLL